MDIKTILALVAIILAIVGYVPYFRDIIRKRTKPHAFSWLVWAVLNAIAFFAQMNDGGGVGAWAVGFTSVATFVIFLFALTMGEKNIKRFDWMSLGGAGIALGLWVVTSEPLLSVILVTVIDIFGFLPTIRKSYHRPFEETLSTYVISTIKYSLATVALENYSLITMLFPATLVVVHVLFVALLLYRRRVFSP
jgi:hypothetical protein